MTTALPRIHGGRVYVVRVRVKYLKKRSPTTRNKHHLAAHYYSWPSWSIYGQEFRVLDKTNWIF